MNKNNKTNNGNENHGSHCQQMSDGSRTQDDVVQLTLKCFRTENVVIAHAIMDEAQDAIDALLNEQLTK